MKSKLIFVNLCIVLLVIATSNALKIHRSVKENAAEKIDLANKRQFTPEQTDSKEEKSDKEIQKRGIFYNSGFSGIHSLNSIWPKTYASHYGYNLNVPSTTVFSSFAFAPTLPTIPSTTLLKYPTGIHYKPYAFGSVNRAIAPLGLTTTQLPFLNSIEGVPEYVLQSGGAVVSSYNFNYPRQKPTIAIPSIQSKPIFPSLRVQPALPIQPVNSIVPVQPEQSIQPTFSAGVPPVTPFTHFFQTPDVQTPAVQSSIIPQTPLVSAAPSSPFFPSIPTAHLQPNHPSIPFIPPFSDPSVLTVPTLPGDPTVSATLPTLPGIPTVSATLPAAPPVLSIPSAPTNHPIAPPNAVLPARFPQVPQQIPNFVSIPLQPEKGSQFPLFPPLTEPQLPDGGSAIGAPQIPTVQKPSVTTADSEFPAPQQPWKPLIYGSTSLKPISHVKPAVTLLPPFTTALAEGYLPPVPSQQMLSTFDHADIENRFAEASPGAHYQDHHYHRINENLY